LVKGFYEEVVGELLRLGYVRKPGGKGSHEKWAIKHTGRTLIVPYNLMSRHTANDILRKAGSARKL
jgi:predicted RNA binding protein YcfA (HicA-like mRNA interferase family)